MYSWLENSDDNSAGEVKEDDVDEVYDRKKN